MADKEINELEEEVEVTETVSSESEAVADDKKAKKSEKKSKDEKKVGFFARIGSLLKRFWKTMKSELKKVTWFSRKQTYASTLLVLVVMVIAAVTLGLLDFGLAKGLEALSEIPFIRG